MKPILIIKAGLTLDSIKKKSADFEDWIISGTGKDRQQFIVTPAYENYTLPQPQYLAGVIISGSHSNVTEHLPWMVNSAKWLRTAAEHNLPMLGICFGHQLLASAFGGKVAENPAGLEIGLTEIQLNVNTATDDLFTDFSPKLSVFTAHTQTVVKLPNGALNLASSSMDKQHAFRIGKNIWGVQFHPEFNCAITSLYIEHHYEKLISEGQNPKQLAANCKNSQTGALLLKRFVKIIENR